MKRAVTAAIGIFICSGASAISGQTLKGSPRAMQRQNSIAVQHDYSFLQTSSQVRRFVDSGLLERVGGNADYTLSGVSHPYARPAVKLFVERLAMQYRAKCGQKLVVTSLTRPVLEQPRNASDLSVHPAGMAIDLRVSNKSSCRRWLESTLLELEKKGVLEATRERRPPHYHVALFPAKYTNYLAQLGVPAGTRTVAANRSVAKPAAKAAATVASAPPATAPPAGQATPPSPSTLAPQTTAPSPSTLARETTEIIWDKTAAPAGVAQSAATASDMPHEERPTYRVNRGDSLWSIARRYGTTIEALKEVNGLSNSQLVAGQVIQLPSPSAVGAQPSGS